jgi:hypothetical protein
MKKLLVTMLVLSLAVVNIADARVRPTTPVAPAAQIMETSKNLIDAAADKDPEAIQEFSSDLVEMLTREDQTADERAYALKLAEYLEVEKRIKAQEIVKSDIGYGWFGFSTTQEQQKQYADAKMKLAQLKADKNRLDKEMRPLAIALGKKYSSAIKVGIFALAAVGIAFTGYVIDKYANKGAGMEALSSGATAVKNRIFKKSDMPKMEPKVNPNTRRSRFIREGSDLGGGYVPAIE